MLRLEKNFELCCDIIRQGAIHNETKDVKTWESWDVSNVETNDKIKSWYKPLSDESHYYVLFDDDIPILGTILHTSKIYDDWDDFNGTALYIYRTAISDEARGKYNPINILEFFKTYAKQLGLEYIRMDFDGSRENLKNFYYRLGFEFVYEDKTDIEYTNGSFEIGAQIKL